MKMVNKQNYSIKILFVGAGDYSIYEQALYNAALELGLKNADIFVWKNYIKSNFKILGDFYYRFQKKLAVGTGVSKMNRSLLRQCSKNKYDLVFIYAGRLIFPNTIKKIKEMGIKIFTYNNDDPFSNYFPRYFWRNCIKAIKFCDVNYVYRQKNIQDVINEGGRNAEILRSYYIDKTNHPCGESNLFNNIPETVFIGHYEDDERIDYIKYIADEGINIGIRKKDFEKKLSGNEHIKLLEDTEVNYNRILCSTKIPIVFLSKINNDTYTRRCFEIPAAEKMLFCPFTEDLASMYKEDEEIVFYRTKEDFYLKLKYYLEHDDEREAIAVAGKRRLMKDGHEAKDRVRQIIDKYNSLKNDGNH